MLAVGGVPLGAASLSLRNCVGCQCGLFQVHRWEAVGMVSAPALKNAIPVVADNAFSPLSRAVYEYFFARDK